MKHIQTYKLFEKNNNKFIYDYKIIKDDSGDYSLDEYVFTNKYGTKYTVSFQDDSLTYTTDKYELEYTNEHDVENVMNTITTIINEFLISNDINEICILNLPSRDPKYNEERNTKKVYNRTKIIKKYLSKNLSKNYKIENFYGNKNEIYIEKK